jgi:hypothetical protein
VIRVHSPFCSARIVPTGLMMASRPGKMPTAPVWRPISWLRSSWAILSFIERVREVSDESLSALNLPSGVVIYFVFLFE